MERLERDWERMVIYDAFPADHWRHLCSTNVIEPPFDAVRLRTWAANTSANSTDENSEDMYTGTVFMDGVIAPPMPRKLRAA